LEKRRNRKFKKTNAFLEFLVDEHHDGVINVDNFD